MKTTTKATPEKIINIVSHGDWIIALDVNGNIWACPVGRNGSMGGTLPNPVYHPILGEWQSISSERIITANNEASK